MKLHVFVVFASLTVFSCVILSNAFPSEKSNLLSGPFLRFPQDEVSKRAATNENGAKSRTKREAGFIKQFCQMMLQIFTDLCKHVRQTVFASFNQIFGGFGWGSGRQPTSTASPGDGGSTESVEGKTGGENPASSEAPSTSSEASSEASSESSSETSSEASTDSSSESSSTESSSTESSSEASSTSTQETTTSS